MPIDPELVPHDDLASLHKVHLKAFKLLKNPSRGGSVSEFRQYHTPFVGREAERRRLEEALFGEKPGAVALVGEPGVGKTRLAAIAVDEGRRKGMRVLAFNGDTQKRTTPFSAIRALVLQCLSLKAAPPTTTSSAS